MLELKNYLYFFNIAMLCFCTFLLNYCTAIYQCALFFTLIIFNVNAITLTYNKSKALQSLFIAVAISLTLLWKLPYYIDGKIINGLVIVSFISVIISAYCSVFIFQLFRNNSIIKAAIGSFTVASIIDVLIMRLFFIINNNLSSARILDIFTRELLFKLIYGLIASTIIAGVLKLSNYNNLRNQDRI